MNHNQLFGKHQITKSVTTKLPLNLLKNRLKLKCDTVVT
jgi:hypothetical protein